MPQAFTELKYVKTIMLGEDRVQFAVIVCVVLIYSIQVEGNQYEYSPVLKVLVSVCAASPRRASK